MKCSVESVNLSGSDEPLEFNWADGALCYVRKHAQLGIRESVSGFYPDGKLMFKYHMHQRHLFGLGTMYHPDGKIMKLVLYDDRGRLNGEVSEFDNCGKLRKREIFVRGKRHGLSVEWDAAGKFFRQELFLRGQDVPKGLNQWIEKTPINARHVIEVKNAEIRRIFILNLGYERLLAGVSHLVLHEEGDQSLVRIDLADTEESIVLVKVRCPSTGAFYALRVPPEMRTVKEAVAWTFDLSEEEYQPVKET